MKRYLIITALDVLKQTNNREHHLLRHLGPRFDEVYVVFRRRCEPGGFRRLLADALWPRVRVVREGHVVYVEVNPLFNHVQGLAMDVAGAYEMEDSTRAPRRGLRGRLSRLLAGLGLWKDLSTLLFLGWSALRHAPGRFDACTAFAPWGNGAAWWMRRRGRVARWCYADRDYEPGSLATPLRRGFATRVQCALLRRADVRVSTGHRLARRLEEDTGCPVDVVTNGVDPTPEPPARSLEAPTLVYTGNVTFWSGLDRVIDALPRVLEVHPDAGLWVVGEGLAGYRKGLEERARALGIHERIRFFGRVDNARVHEILLRCHVGLAVFQPLIFRRYAFPLKVLEYMAAGLPTLGTADTETEDLLRRHACGFAVPYDAQQVASGLLRILESPERYRELAEAARAASHLYDWPDLMAREYALLMGEDAPTRSAA